MTFIITFGFILVCVGYAKGNGAEGDLALGRFIFTLLLAALMDFLDYQIFLHWCRP